MDIINTHTHFFTNDDVPDKFFGWGVVPLLRNRYIGGLVKTILKDIIPWTDKDKLSRYEKYMEIGGLGSQEAIYLELAKNYPVGTKVVCLTMDMAYMGAGRVKREYREQLLELGALSKKYPNIIPFMHVDPRRPGVFALLREMVEEYGFKGVKLYCSLGYFPYDVRLWPVYEYCEAKNLPIITHCSPSNPVHFMGSDKELMQLLENRLDPFNTKDKTRKELTSIFAHPNGYLHVIDRYEKLKIQLAHWGSESEWLSWVSGEKVVDNWHRIVTLAIKNINNFYTDISFTAENRKLWPWLLRYLRDPIIAKKVNFGSDFYMTITETDEHTFSNDLSEFLGNELFEQIAVKNPSEFLDIK